MKYIMFKTDEDTPRLVPIIFPDFLVHSEVARFMELYFMRTHDSMEVTPVSAGQLNILVSSVHGASETLKLSSKPTDASVINTYSYLHGLIETE